MNVPLGELLKSETRTFHMAVERCVLMDELMHARLARAAYSGLLRNLHAIYVALEESLKQHARYVTITAVIHPGLWRAKSLEHDLDVLCGASWAEDLVLVPSTTRYVARLCELRADHPELLLAHSYVRYLGDLSGGQMMRNVLASSTTLEGLDALAFYDFGDEPATRNMIREFRYVMGLVQVDNCLACELVAEAKMSFELHQRIFEELAAAYGLTGRA